MRRLIAIALLLISACGGGAPAAPTTTPPAAAPTPAPGAPSAFAGIWDFTYQIDGCESSRFWYCPNGGFQTMTLRIEENGGVSALAVSRSVMVPLTGTTREVGELLLAGQRIAQTDSMESTQRIRDMRLRVDNGTLGGTFVLTTAAPTNMTEIAATIKSVESHRPIESDQRFDGAWQGGFRILSCDRSPCSPLPNGYIETLDLTLSDRGASVDGTLKLAGDWVIPVSGTVDGSRLAVEGSAERTSGAIVTRLKVREWDSRRDRLGVLTGTFEYEWERVTPTGRETATSRIEIRYVAKRP
jgi:hypothetical protein